MNFYLESSLVISFTPIAGEVITSNNKDFEVGDFVTGALGVKVYGGNGEGLEKCDPNLSPLGSWLGGFGVSGLTAYFALLMNVNLNQVRLF